MRLHANRQEMQAKLTGNVQFTKNRFLQMVPLFLKKIQSWHFPTNWLAFVPTLGPTPILESFTFPRNGTPHPSHGSDVGTSHTPLPHCASISYGNTMAITFAGTGVSSETERRFFSHLVQAGIHVKVESNRTH